MITLSFSVNFKDFSHWNHTIKYKNSDHTGLSLNSLPGLPEKSLKTSHKLPQDMNMLMHEKVCTCMITSSISSVSMVQPTTTSSVL